MIILQNINVPSTPLRIQYNKYDLNDFFSKSSLRQNLFSLNEVKLKKKLKAKPSQLAVDMILVCVCKVGGG